MKKSVFKFHYPCPWCSRGEVQSDGRAKITISAQCPKCGRFFRVDLDTVKTERAQAIRKMSR